MITAREFTQLCNLAREAHAKEDINHCIAAAASLTLTGYDYLADHIIEILRQRGGK